MLRKFSASGGVTESSLSEGGWFGREGGRLWRTAGRTAIR